MEACLCFGNADSGPSNPIEAGLALKNPPKKTHPKKPQKTHLKKPTKNVFFVWVFLNFLFFMKIIQTFLFQTDFL
jgi:hypothetical protein